MTTENAPILSKMYVMSVTVLGFILPAVCTFVETMQHSDIPFSINLAGKWFIFSAVGLRLFVAGLKQAIDPAFTAKQIFHINNPEVHPIVRELGFANLCFGLVGIISLFQPQWRVVSAFGSGLYYGFAAAQHIIKKPVGANEMFALVTDVVIFGLLVMFFVRLV